MWLDLDETQSELKYKRLLEKSEALFISNGYRNVSIEEIAAAAGISKVTIYKHFNSKEALFMYCVKNIINAHYDVLESELDKRNGSVEKLTYLFEYSLTSYDKYSSAFYKDTMEIPYIWEKIVGYRKKRAIKICEEILKEGIASKELREIDIKYTVKLLLCLGESLPKIYPFDDAKEAKIFMKNYYNFIKYALINK